MYRTVATFIDFAKAFDTLNHSVPIEKIKNTGMAGHSIRWFQSYLEGRKQRTKVNHQISSIQNITTGVPQDSVLGPLFFIIYVNKLSTVTDRGNIIMFADDTVLCSHLDPKNPNLTANQQDLDSLHTWCKKHNLSINLNKTSYVIFGQKRLINKVAKKQIQVKVNGMPIKQAEAFKYLGFTIDSTLSLNTHINTVIRTVNAKLNTLMQTRKLVGEKTALLVYKTLILPINITRVQ